MKASFLVGLIYLHVNSVHAQINKHANKQINTYASKHRHRHTHTLHDAWRNTISLSHITIRLTNVRRSTCLSQTICHGDTSVTGAWQIPTDKYVKVVHTSAQTAVNKSPKTNSDVGFLKFTLKREISIKNNNKTEYLNPFACQGDLC